MHETRFDSLPTELLHEIFSYFWCYEIIQSFYSISERVNKVITSYDSYLLDFSSENLRKNEFDLICSIVSVKQIIGLKIGKTRFNLFDRYLIEINGEELLTRLRSFWIDETISPNESFIKWFYSNIDYNKLLSFRFDNKLFKDKLNSSFNNLFRLVGSSSQKFRKLSKYIPKNLIFLHMFFDSVDDLNCFLDYNSSPLKSLGISIRCGLYNINQFSSLLNKYQWTQLIQLNLNLQGKY